jgi:hypothetical protein
MNRVVWLHTHIREPNSFVLFQEASRLGNDNTAKETCSTGLIKFLKPVLALIPLVLFYHAHPLHFSDALVLSLIVPKGHDSGAYYVTIL